MSEMSGSCSPNMFKAAQKGHSSPGWLSLVTVPLLAVIMLCATLSLWALMSWVPKGREGAERMTFPFLGYPGTFRTAQTHPSLKSHLPGAEAVAGVSLLPAFWLSPKPSGSPDSTHMASSLLWSPVSLYALSVAHSVSEVRLGCLDFCTMDHSLPQSLCWCSCVSLMVSEGRREIYIKATQRHHPPSRSFALSRQSWLLATSLALLHVFRSPLSFFSLH